MMRERAFLRDMRSVLKKGIRLRNSTTTYSRRSCKSTPTAATSSVESDRRVQGSRALALICRTWASSTRPASPNESPESRMLSTPRDVTVCNGM